MSRLLFCLFCISIPLLSSSQNIAASYVKLTGLVLSDKDSAAVSAIISYEKLPYYDDMGLTKSKADGSYEFYLIRGLTYNFTVKATGFETINTQVEIDDPDEDEQKIRNFMMKPDGEVQLITLENLIFSRGSEQISASSYQELDQLVIWLNDRPNTIIQLEGHTDFEGNEDANMALSQARVESVKDYLQSKGIKKKRVLTKAFGGSVPLSTDRTDEAKARNRRVEVRVIRN
ncbi:MAG: OmpA family protein [Bacteroidota bacterium]